MVDGGVGGDSDVGDGSGGGGVDIGVGFGGGNSVSVGDWSGRVGFGAVKGWMFVGGSGGAGVGGEVGVGLGVLLRGVSAAVFLTFHDKCSKTYY